MKNCFTLITLLLFLIVGKIQAQPVPKIGTDSHLEIANWNIEWFGSTSYGPSDEVLQKKNVLSVLKNTDLDIWGLCEVSSASAWDSLKANMPEYGGIISTWSQTQKTAILYKKSTCKLLKSGNILTTYSKEFANGRTPLQATIVYANNTFADTIVLIQIHLKANVGVDTAKLNSLNNRKSSAALLKGYLDTFAINKKVIVLGDWNDDLDVSVYNNLKTPFDTLLKDVSRYFFATEALTNSGQQSTASYPNMIDHQCMNLVMKKGFMKDSCRLMKANTWITSYATNTSDHFPVYSVFDFHNLYVQQLRKEPNLFYDNGETIVCKTPSSGAMFTVFNAAGTLIWEGKNLNQWVVSQPGLFVIHMRTSTETFAQKIEIIR